MEGKQSLYLIVLLLAALFIGPVVVLTQDHPGAEKRITLKASPLGPLQDRIVDAPASIPLPRTHLPGLPK